MSDSVPPASTPLGAPRERAPSVEDFAEISSRIDNIDEKLTKVLAKTESDPPQLRWVQRRIGKLVLLGTREGLRRAISMAVTAAVTGAGVWLYRDCREHVATVPRVTVQPLHDWEVPTRPDRPRPREGGTP
jgi:tetrahydromethanopterin S-methyltransferase subunit G